MVELLKDFARRVFRIKVPITEPVLKTRAQIVQEGKSSYLPKRHIHGVPHLIKKH